MAINNLNPRRTVWFSPNEPSNKYDIWLSKNAHLDENGEHTTDSNAQRDCDYIFKIYDCGKWLPIVGFNTTAAHKIDTVDGVSYTPTGSTTPKVGKHEFHPAIFTKETPAELFDYGTVAEVLEGLVNENEWLSIINNGGLGDAIEYYLGNGDIEIPFATTTKIGGIYSDTHGRVPHESYRFYPIECMFYPDYQQYELKQGRLCTNAHEIKVALNYIDNVLYDEDPTSELIVNGWKGIVTLMREGHEGVWVGMTGVNSTNTGKFPTVNNDGDGINWVNASEIVTNGTGASSQNSGFLNWNGSSFTFLNITSGGEIEIVEDSLHCAGGILIDGLSFHSPGTQSREGVDIDLEYNKFYTIITYGSNGLSSLEGLSGITFKSLPKDSRPIYLYIQPYHYEEFATDSWYIDSNNALLDFTYQNNGLSTTLHNCLIGRENLVFYRYLIEIRFGIIKIEKINSPITQ